MENKLQLKLGKSEREGKNKNFIASHTAYSSYSCNHSKEWCFDHVTSLCEIKKNSIDQQFVS